MSNIYILAAVAGSGLCVFLLRYLPFACFRGRAVPEWLRRLGDVLPSAIMVILVIYCLRNTDIHSWSSLIPALCGTIVTAAVHIIKGNTIVSVAAGTAVYMSILALF